MGGVEAAAGREQLTLGVHEVADGDGVVLGRIDLHRLEHGVNMASGSSAHVLLAQAAHLHVDGHGLELVGQRHLLELHLVDGGLGAAKQRSCCEESSLHDGRLGMGDV